MRIANQCKVLETVVDSGIGLSMAGTDVLPEMEKAHWLIWDGYKDEVWRHDPAKNSLKAIVLGDAQGSYNFWGLPLPVDMTLDRWSSSCFFFFFFLWLEA